MAIPKNPKRSGGPRTPHGKAASARNPVNCGIASQGWLEDHEAQEYQQLVAQLKAQHPSEVSIDLTIERLAVVTVKLRRLLRVENAEYAQARSHKAQLARERPENSMAGQVANTPSGQAHATAVMVQAALPCLQRLDTLARYQTTLERQASRLQEELHTQSQRALQRSQQRGAVAGTPGFSNANGPDVTDVQATEVRSGIAGKRHQQH